MLFRSDGCLRVESWPRRRTWNEVDSGFQTTGISCGFRGLIEWKVIITMKTKTKRKRHNAASKAKVGLEAVIGIKTVTQIAREHSLHPV